MGYTNDTVNNLIRLAPDGAGNAEMEGLLETAPAGANQMVFGFQHWLDELGSNASHQSDLLALATNALYWGLSFTGAHIDTGDPNIAAGTMDPNAKKFFGVIQESAISGRCGIKSSDSVTAKQDYAAPCYYNPSYGTTTAYFTDGNGGNAGDLIGQGGSVTLKSDEDMNLTVPINPTIGATATYWWRIWGSTIDERVFAQMWINTDSIDLSTYDLDDLDNDDPLSSIPASNSWITPVYTINGAAEVGTNWRPSSGVMGFPTHWIARWPFETIGIDYVLKGPPLIKYSAIEVV